MKKRILSLVLVLCTVLAFMPTVQFTKAAETTVVASGTCGATESDNVTWKLSSDGTMTISGSGKMKDFKTIYDEPELIHDDCPWKDYIGSIKAVVIGDGVTRIGDYSFYICPNLTSIIFGKDITEIGYGAFWGCNGLNNVDIHDGVTTIESYAFKECSNFTEVVIPNSVTSIKEGVFSYCNNLEAVAIGCNVQRIDQYAFGHCTALANILIPDNVKSIGMFAFYDCAALETVVIPDGVSVVGEKAFEECTSLKTLIFKGDVAKIENNVFYKCSSLTDIYFFGDVTRIKSSAFANCNNLSKIYCNENNSVVEEFCRERFAGAELIHLNGTCGATENDNVTWKLTPDGTLTLSGTGTVVDYSSTNAPWKELADEGMIKNVTIGKDVTFSSLGVSGCSYTVSSEAALRTAIGNDGTVTLGDDIDITSTLEINGDVTLDLNGRVLKMTGDGSVIAITSSGDLTLTDGDSAATHTDTSLPVGGVITGGKDDSGGGVYNNGTFTMQGGTIINCTATEFGGGVYNDNNSEFTMEDGTISGCMANYGGGVYNMGVFTMESGIITGGFANIGGGVHNVNTFNMKGGSIVDCTVISSGGGIYNGYGTVTMEGGTISGCVATYQFSSGGGVFISADGTFVLKGGTITGCSAYNGGNVRNNGYIQMEGGTITGSEVDNKGRMLNTSATGATMCYAPLKNGGKIVDNVVEFYNRESLYAWEVVPENAKAVKPAEPRKFGYQFEGWSLTEGDSKEQWDFDDAVTKSMTLSAEWSGKEYTVSFDTSDVTKIDDINIGWDDAVLEDIENPAKEGFAFAGWTFNGNIVDEDAVLSELIDDDTLTGITLTANWEEIITLTVPFVTTVDVTGNKEPGKVEFSLELAAANAFEESYSSVELAGKVTTNGEGNYNGTLTLKGTKAELFNMLCQGAFIRQVDGKLADWAYDDSVWCLLWFETASILSNDDGGDKYSILIYPAEEESDGDEVYFHFDTDEEPFDSMSFVNRYSGHTHIYTLKHNTSEHWNECPCGDIKNEELHDFGEWTETKAATDTSKGEKTRTCTVCGYFETEEIPMTSHKYGEWKTVKQATETEGGKRERVCSACGHIESEETPKLDAAPQTGYTGHIVFWSSLAAVSALSIVLFIIMYRKKKQY